MASAEEIKMKQIGFVLLMSLVLANCAGPQRIVQENTVANPDGTITKTVVAEKVGVNPLVGFANWWYNALCLYALRDDFCPECTDPYSEAYAEEARRVEEEKRRAWEENERERGINDARKDFVQ